MDLESTTEDWEAQWKQRDKVSTAMGQYLLKGYRMLSSTCSDCNNVLLRSREGVEYCVNCSEFKKTPTSPQEVAVVMDALDHVHSDDLEQSGEVYTAFRTTRSQKNPADSDRDCLDKPNPAIAAVGGDKDSLMNPVCYPPSTQLALKALEQKLEWASKELMTTTSVKHSKDICCLIKACADAILSVKHTSVGHGKHTA